MYGDAVKCDVCDRTEIVSHKPWDVDEWGVPSGWVHVTLNNPVDWRFAEKPLKADMQGSLDCCSLSCAYAALGEAKSKVVTP